MVVPDTNRSPKLMKKLEEEDPQLCRHLTTKEQQVLSVEMLEKKGGLDGLKDWPPELAWKVCRLLLEFHMVFSLEPNGMGCTDTTEHSSK